MDMPPQLHAQVPRRDTARVRREQARATPPPQAGVYQVTQAPESEELGTPQRQLSGSYCYFLGPEKKRKLSPREGDYKACLCQSMSMSGTQLRLS